MRGAAALTLSLANLRFSASCSSRPEPAQESARIAGAVYQSWGDIYRKRWAWDHIGKSTHFVNCCYQRGCNWDVYVRDGIVFREEQSAT